MTRTYTPDCWRVIEFDYGTDEPPLRKVFAGWYGGYANGDSWKLSSGITKTHEFEDRYEFENYSGSTYVCFKPIERMSGYMMQVYSSFEREVEESPDVTMKIIEYRNKK
jgi:hypothetical protein